MGYHGLPAVMASGLELERACHEGDGLVQGACHDGYGLGAGGLQAEPGVKTICSEQEWLDQAGGAWLDHRHSPSHEWVGLPRSF